MTLLRASRPLRPSLRSLMGYQRLAGTCDLLTGLLLLLIPEATMRLMGFREPANVASAEGISLIGVFVLATGLAYLVTARVPANARDWARIETTMLITAMTRAVVSVYLICQLTRDVMEWPWIFVAITDGSMAFIQFFGLRREWWC